MTQMTEHERTGKAAIIIDGRNFYVGWRKTCPAMAVDYNGMIDWLVGQSDCTKRGGVHFLSIDPRFFVSTDDNSRDRVQRVITDLKDVGAEICLLPSRTKETHCRECQHTQTVVIEKQGEAEACVRAIREADEGADVVVFLTSDVDILPIVKELQDNWGVNVVVASWAASPIAVALRDTADRTVVMGPNVPWLKRFGDGSDEDIFVDELIKAEHQFEGGYVGLHYFLTKWRSDALTPVTEQRSLLLNKLVDQKRIEVYDAQDGKKAVRSLTIKPATEVHDAT